MWLKTEKSDFEVAGTSFSSDCCFYCGSVGDTVDHVPPVSTRRMLEVAAATGVKIPNYPYVEVPCCHECNCGLSDKLCTLRERKAYIVAWLAKRHKKLLDMPSWTEQELKSMSPNMQQFIRANWIKRDVLLDRIRYASLGTGFCLSKIKPRHRKSKPKVKHVPRHRDIWKCYSGSHCIRLEGKKYRSHGILYCCKECKANFYKHHLRS